MHAWAPQAEFVVRSESDSDLPALKGTEIFLSQTDIIKVCPMVGYSGCAARVLSLKDHDHDQAREKLLRNPTS